MSRKATMEYVGAKRRAYSVLKSKKAKSAVIYDFCQVTGAERKYAIRPLTGSRRCREHAGRGKTYTPDAEAASECADPAAVRRLTALRERTNPIRLLEDIHRRHSLILRKQDALARREAQGEPAPPCHCTAPPSPSDPLGVQHLTDRPRPPKNLRCLFYLTDCVWRWFRTF